MLDMFGLGELTRLELVFAACAVLGGAVFLIRMVLFLLGVGDDVDGFDGDHDAGEGTSGISIQGITAFFMMFGLVGMAILQSGGAPLLAIGGGGVAGIIALWASAQLYRFFRRLQSSGNVTLESAIGTEGSVYLSIPERGAGQIQIVVGGRLRTYDARSEKGVPLQTGDRVKVLRVVDGNVFMVEAVE